MPVASSHIRCFWLFGSNGVKCGLRILLHSSTQVCRQSLSRVAFYWVQLAGGAFRTRKGSLLESRSLSDRLMQSGEQPDKSLQCRAVQQILESSSPKGR